MSTNRNKDLDKAATRQILLASDPPQPKQGTNWLGHGSQDGRSAQIDYLLLQGATMKRLLLERSTEASVRSHFQHLKTEHDLPVTRRLDGRYGFDREHLGVPQPVALPGEMEDATGIFEGAVRTVLVNAYERSASARQKCIEHYGVVCVVCGFNFKEEYGDFAEGFIHVHHLKPIAQAGKEYKVDPLVDLRPVCPNCHAALHLSDPPVSIDELREIVSKGRA